VITFDGTGEQSGTCQFFTQMSVREDGVSRDDYTVTDGRPTTADGVAEGLDPYSRPTLLRFVEMQTG
jgi:hypothetical protein